MYPLDKMVGLKQNAQSHLESNTKVRSSCVPASFLFIVPVRNKRHAMRRESPAPAARILGFAHPASLVRGNYQPLFGHGVLSLALF